MSERDLVVRVATLKALYDKVKTAYYAARADAVGELGPGDRLHARLSDGSSIGTVTVVKGRSKAAVTDNAALLEWVRLNAPSEIEVTERVRESYVGVLLDRCENVDGAAMHHKTGELLPGVAFSTGEDYARVSQTADQLAAFTEAWNAGSLPTIAELGSVIPLEVP